MKREYNRVSCKNCDAVFRLRVSMKNYGIEVPVTCFKCGTKFGFIAYDTKKLDYLINMFSLIITKTLAEDPNISDAVRIFHQAGFRVLDIASQSSIEVLPIERPPTIKSKVILGIVQPGTYSRDDLAFLSNLKIGSTAKNKSQ